MAPAADKEEATKAAAAVVKEATGERMVTLESMDGVVFEVSAAAARQSKLLKDLIKETEGEISVAEVTAATLEKVVQYLNKHADDADEDSTTAFRGVAAASGKVDEWDAKLVDGLGSQDALFDLIAAANYLDIDGLLDAACKKIADMMRGKTTEEIRAIFNIPDDYTEEEKKELRREYAWAFPSHDDDDEEYH